MGMHLITSFDQASPATVPFRSRSIIYREIPSFVHKSVKYYLTLSILFDFHPASSFQAVPALSFNEPRAVEARTTSFFCWLAIFSNRRKFSSSILQGNRQGGRDYATTPLLMSWYEMMMVNCAMARMNGVCRIYYGRLGVGAASSLLSFASQLLLLLLFVIGHVHCTRRNFLSALNLMNG